MYYYQVGGYRAHTSKWFGFDARRLATYVFSALSANVDQDVNKNKNSIELVLGILSTGSSYLLVTEGQMEQMLRFGGRNGPGRPSSPQHASTYASLSPISFSSVEELHLKLKTYAQKKQSGRGTGKDTSQANKMFDQLNPARASFEHQRLLWSAIQSPIDVEKFALCELPVWIVSTSLVALTFQTWRFDPFEKRRKDPTILSFEMASVRCIAFEQDNYSSKISNEIHVTIEEHTTMTNGPSMYPNNHKPELVKKADLSRRLVEFFASIDSKYALLLVYDAEQTRSGLSKLGVDVSIYTEGIDTLLYGQNREQRGRRASSNAWRHQGDFPYSQGTTYDSRSNWDRRSRSPQRRIPYSPRPRSPPSVNVHKSQGIPPEDEQEGEEGEEEDDDDDAPPPVKVYIIDVRTLFLSMSRFAPGSLNGPRDIASYLGISKDLSECRLLIDAWRIMASGKAIDEQYADRWSAKATASNCALKSNQGSSDSKTRAAGLAQPDRNSDEEIDPNDIPVPVNSNAPNYTLAGMGDSDYDSDDSYFS